jgi:hypothetical protein
MALSTDYQNGLHALGFFANLFTLGRLYFFYQISLMLEAFKGEENISFKQRTL